MSTTKAIKLISDNNMYKAKGCESALDLAKQNKN